MTPFAKRLSIVLAVSIALNLLLAGIMVGRVFRHPPLRGDGEAHGLRPERPQSPERPERGGRPAALRGVFREHGDELRDKRRAISDARRTAREALDDEPFDRTTLERALEGVRKETLASQEIMHKALVEAAVKASPEERKKLARGLERMGPPHDLERGPGPKP